MSRRVVDVQGDGLLRFHDSLAGESQRCEHARLQGVGQRGRRLQGFLQMVVRPALGAKRRHIQIEGPIVLIHVPIDRGQRRVGLGIVRVEPNGLFEEGHRLGQVLGRQELVVGPTLEIGVVGRGILRVVAGLLDLFLARQTDREGRNDLLRNLILQIKTSSIVPS